MADKRISQLIERTDIANNDVLPIVASGATTTNKVTISTIQDWMQENLDVGVTSVGLSMPSAFTVSNSPVTTSGNISVTGAGTTAQYIRGDGSLADFPSSTGGGSSVSYYLNGSVNQGTIGGIAYRELSKSPILGAGTDFTINADGYIASFITDAGDPNLLLIPAGNWNFETYLQASSGGGSPTFYIELYKVSGSTATLIASNSGSPELIAFGTNINPYFSALAVPETTLALTDRLAIRYYVAHSGRTITLHTENNTLCQIITTFTTGLTALNGLTAQVQNFATGTSGTDFNISSASTTHTFNIPSASGTARGLITTGSQTIAGEKTFTSALNGTSATFTAAGSTFVSATTTGGSDMRISSGATTGFVGTTSNHPLSFVVNNAVVATIAVGGAATFSSSVNAGQLFLSTPSNLVGNINSTNTNGGALTWQTNGTIIADIGTAQMLFGTGGADTFGINARGSRSLILGTNNTARLTINSSGAATFSSSITASSIIRTGGTSSQFLMADGSVNTSVSPTGAYLPLTGGTLTGALNGTTASFTGSVTSVGGFINGSDFRYNPLGNTNGNPVLVLKNPSSGVLSIASEIIGDANVNSNSLAFSVSNVANGRFNALTIASTGAATFSSSVTAAGLTLNRAATGNANGFILQTAGTSNWYVGSSAVGSNTDLQFYNHSAGSVVFNIANTTGAATFSSTLKAKSFLPAFSASDLSNQNSGIVWTNGTIGETFGFVVQDGVFFQGDNSNINNAFGVRAATSDGFIGAPVFVVKGTGNVGIGTASPGTYDSAKIGTSHRFLNVQSSSSAYAVATLAGNQSSADSRIGYLTFVNDNNSSSYKYSAWLGSEVEGSTANQQGGRLIFSTSSDASSAGPIERMRITSGGDIQLPVGNKFIYANPSVGSTTIGAGFNLDAANNRLTLWTNNTERMRITSDGFARLSASSGGIQFNGDTAAANALDDYEEGTWTMGISFGGASVGVTYVLNTGRYTKVGRQVTATGFISLSSKGSSTGDARVTGLPFAIGNDIGNYSAPSFGYINKITFADQLSAYGEISTTQFLFEETTNAGVKTTITNSDFANDSEIMVSFTYFV
jgi:hypothetical protein